ncbi:MAG: hypothetical protein QME79_06250 [Bacillota bacterium]|nr:hypothetical protein [Bacillota bacterium]
MLTDRGRQFLDRVKKCYAETQKPIHYTTIAEALGVSRWTAYDMLKNLEKEGYLRAEYSTSLTEGKSAGRSQVVFVPTDKPLEGEDEGRRQRSEEWFRLKTRVMQFFRGTENLSPGELVERILTVPDIENPLAFCTYASGLVVTIAVSRVKGRIAWLRRLLNRFARPEFGLAGFTGTALGLLLSAPPQSAQMEEAILDFVEKFHFKLTVIPPEQVYLLLDFVKDALESGSALPARGVN